MGGGVGGGVGVGGGGGGGAGSEGREVHWLQFLAVCCGSLVAHRSQSSSTSQIMSSTSALLHLYLRRFKPAQLGARLVGLHIRTAAPHPRIFKCSPSSCASIFLSPFLSSLATFAHV